MDKAAPDGGEAVVDMIQQSIHQVVAHIGSCSVGHLSGNAFLSDGLHHGLDGQGGKIGVFPLGEYRLIHRLIALVIGDAGVPQIDGHPFGADGLPPSRLADAHHHIGPFLLHGLAHPFNGLAEHTGDDFLYHLGARNGFRQAFHDLLGRIDGLSAEGLKARH